MEAIPKLPMVSFEAKISPENVDFAAKVKQLIAERFGEDPSAFSKEVKELESLRASSCIRIPESVDGLSTLKCYYAQMLFLKNRFKLGTETSFQFSWRDLYTGGEFVSSEIHYELASVLYNIGALHSRMGSRESREDSESMKMAVAHFQCAAWAFHSLPDFHPQEPESDLCAELMGFKSQLSLAQAQECIMEKSILDARKPLIISKVGGQVVEYYKQALRSLDYSNQSRADQDRLSDIVGNRQNKIWRNILDFKIAYYSALSWLHMGMNAEENQKMGERVTYYKASNDSLAQSVKLAKKLDSSFKAVSGSLSYASDVIVGKLDNATKENEFIYHEKVPDLESLPEIKGASLVKGIPFDPCDPEVSGPDLFRRLVPMEAHEASSLYSEEQAKLLRNVGGEIDAANSELAVFLSAMQLDDIPAEDQTQLLPNHLIECSAALSVRKSAVSQLQEGMAKLASVSAEVEASLMEIQNSLVEDMDKESKLKNFLGERPNALISELDKETRKYHEAHSMASESNLALSKAMRLHVKNLQLLSKNPTELEGHIPKLSDLDEDVLISLRNMREIMKKVEEMRSQRQQLEAQLRESVRNDDITTSLAQSGNKDKEKVFEAELKKHGKTVEYIRKNILAQRNILTALGEKNVEYAKARQKVDEILKQRDDMIGSLVASYHAYEDLLDKTTKGLEFYGKLEENVTKLLARVHGVVKVQEEERAQRMEYLTKKKADARNLSLSLVMGKGELPQMGGGEYGLKSDFAPGAPPLDTPEHQVPPSAIGSGVVKPGKPRLIDYLKARQEGGGAGATGTGVPTVTPAVSDTEKEKPDIGVRPQPVGSETPTPAAQPYYPGAPTSMQDQLLYYQNISRMYAGIPPTNPYQQGMPGMMQPHFPPAMPSVASSMPAPVVSTSGSQNKPNNVAAGGGVTSSQATVAGTDGQQSQIMGIPVTADGSVPSAVVSTMSGNSQPNSLNPITSYSGHQPALQGQVHPGLQMPASLPSAVNQATSHHKNSSMSTSLPSSVPQSVPQASQPTSLPQTSGAPTANVVPFQYPSAVATTTGAINVAPQANMGLARPMSAGYPYPYAYGQPYNVNSVYGPPASGYAGVTPATQSSHIASDMSQNKVQHQQVAPAKNTSSSSNSGSPAHHQQIQTSRPSSAPSIGQGAKPVYPVSTAQTFWNSQPQQPTSTPLADASIRPTFVGQAASLGTLPSTASPGSNTLPTLSSNYTTHLSQHSNSPAQVVGSTVTVPASMYSNQQSITASGTGYTPVMMAGQPLPKPGHATAPASTAQAPVSSSYVGSQQATSFPSGQAQYSPLPNYNQGHNIPSMQPNRMPYYNMNPVAGGGGSQPAATARPQPQVPQPGTRPVQHTVGQATTANMTNQPGVRHIQPAGHSQSVGMTASQGAGQSQTTGVIAAQSAGMAVPTGAGQIRPSGTMTQPFGGQMQYPGSTTVGVGQNQMARMPIQPGVVQPQPTTSQPAGGQIPPPVQPGYGQTYQGMRQPQPTVMTGPQRFPHSQLTGITAQPGYSQSQAGGSFVQSHSGQNQPTVIQSQTSVGHDRPVAGVTMHHPTVGQNIPAVMSAQSNFIQSMPTMVPNQFAAGQPQSNMRPTYPAAQQAVRPMSAAGLNQAFHHPVTVSASTHSAAPQSTAAAQQAQLKSNIDLLAGLDMSSDVSHPAIQPVPLNVAAKPVVDSQPAGATMTMPAPTNSESLMSNILMPRSLEEPNNKGAKPASFELDLDRLKTEAEKLENMLHGLTSKTLQGIVPLDSKWKEVTQSIENRDGKLSVSVARCYPMKNRARDILPFDQTRVELKCGKDDYVNASHVKGLSPHSPNFIITQLPPNKHDVFDLWSVVWHEMVEIVVSVISAADMADAVYMPSSKAQPLVSDDFTVALQSVKACHGCQERVFNITMKATKQTRAVIHLEMAGWPGPDLPANASPLLDTVKHLLHQHRLQRSTVKPILVHCKDGGYKSGVFTAMVAALAEIEVNNTVPDLIAIFGQLVSQRKGVVNNKMYLKFVWEALLYHLQDILLKHGVISGKTKSHSRHPSQDFLSRDASPRKSITSIDLPDSLAGGAAADLSALATTKVGDANGGSNFLDPTNQQTLHQSVSHGPGIKDETDSPAGTAQAGGDVPAASDVGAGGAVASEPGAILSSIGKDAGSSMDINSLTQLNLTDSPRKKKITKEDFLNPSKSMLEGASADPGDPLSQLNPLWSIKK